MKIKKTVLAVSLVVVCSSSYFIGYYDGAKDIAKEFRPKLNELRARTKELHARTNEVNDLAKKVTGLNSDVDYLNTLVKLKDEQLAVPVTVSAPGVNFNSGTKVGKFVISAYSPYDNPNYINSDGDPTNTATGTTPKPGTFAVDPKVIPYGTNVTILYPDGTIERGVAEDTGGAINNNRIDVFRYSFDTAIKFGMKEAIVIWN